MRWVLFAVALYIVVVLQTAVTPLLSLHAVRPDLTALLAIHIALAGPAVDAVLAAWIIGLAVDLNGAAFGSHANVGANALAYSLTALLILRLRSVFFRDHASTYFFLALVGTFSIQTVTTLHMLYVTDQMSRLAEGLMVSAYTAIFTAAVSPYAFWVLRRARNVLGFGPVRTLRVGRRSI